MLTCTLSAVAANAEVLSSFGKNGDADPNKQLRVGGVGMTSVQGTGQTGIRTSAFKKGVLGNEKSATKFARPGMNAVSLFVDGAQQWGPLTAFAWTWGRECEIACGS